jgi:diadenosine tetraphosphate (Ap4A) HIT family hydrolase
MQAVAAAYDSTLQPERIHYGLYAEGIRHIHLHLLPRLPGMPVGNIPISTQTIFLNVLQKTGLRRRFSPQESIEIANKLRLSMHSKKD